MALASSGGTVDHDMFVYTTPPPPPQWKLLKCMIFECINVEIQPI